MSTMFKHFILFLGVYAIAHTAPAKTQSENDNEATEIPRPQEENIAKERNQSSHVHIHHDKNITSSNQYIAHDESKYFVSALFKKYSSSNLLSLDGLVRLLCRLGLVPVFTHNESAEADDTFRAERTRSIHSLDCGKITFDEVPFSFKDHKTAEFGHELGGKHKHDGHLDSHSDHDHQPSRNVTRITDANHHDHIDHDHHDHFDEHDHHINKDHDNDDEHDHHHDDEHDHHDGNGHKPGSGSNYVSKSTQVGHSDADSTKQKTSSPQNSKRMKRRRIQNVNPLTDSDTQNINETVHVHPDHLECVSPKELLDFFHIPLKDLNIQQFTLLCPALLYKLDSGNCQHQGHHDHDHHEEEEKENAAVSFVSGKVWGYSTAAVTIISLAGLLGVAVIPIMQKVFYNHLLSFLVAVAVGALSGDALLHLLPHAISKNQAHNHDSHDGHGHASEEKSHEEDHLESVWKGLIALTCIFFFFLVERILTIVTEKKRKKKAMSRLQKKHCEKLCDAERSSKVGAKLSSHEDGDYMDCEQMVMVVHPNRALKGYADATHDAVMHQCDESLSQAEHNLDEDNGSHAALGHSHSHGHDHSHFSTVPGSVAAVAWMVIFGDGIHNFSDGLAIGAAFASSVTGGISTSIAVFCHELPHEIGDFAVLLRAGMSVKQAVVYNCVSSVLCFIGMLVGVAIGNIHNASLWIFAGVGGMFIYISMVDMLPEMTAVDTKKGENHFLHLLLQVCGMMIGSGIMLIIAVFEHDLQRMLD